MEMESPQNFPITSFKTGVKMEERRLTWTIENFHVVLLHDSLIKAQQIEFTAGASIGLDSKWSVELDCEKEDDGNNWVGIYFKLKEQPALKSEFLFASCAFNITTGYGRTIFNRATTVQNMYSKDSAAGCGLAFMKRGEEGECLETVTIDVTLKLYSPSVMTPSLDAAVVKFATTSSLKALEEVGLLRESGSLTDIRIMSSDKTWSTAKKEILPARSPDFEAMLKTNFSVLFSHFLASKEWKGGKEGVVQLSDLNSKALQVLLHYIFVGGPDDDWMESEVLVELRNVSAKYQLPQLLHLLDGVMGKVGDVRNGPLLIVANRLSLKQAEGDLLSFIRIKGAGSADEFFGILNSIREEPSQEDTGSVGGGEDTHSHRSSSGNTREMKGNGRDGEEPPDRKKKRQDK